MGDRKDIWPIKTVSLILTDSLPEHVLEDNITLAHLKNSH